MQIIFFPQPKGNTMNSDPAFWSRVNKAGKCWEYCGARLSGGYGWISRLGTQWLAHRYSWLISRGHIPKRKLILHKCDNRACVRPSHLYVGDHIKNRKDRIERGPRANDCKMTWDLVREMRGDYLSGIAQFKLKKKYRLSDAQVSRIINQKNWREYAL